MEHPSHILTSNFAPHHTSLDDLTESRTRIPLSNAAANSQTHALASEIYHENKLFQGGLDRPMCPLPTLPSQPARPISLGQRRQFNRRQRKPKARNPIVDSPQYQAYRDRSCREGNEDQKWPAILEDAFLDALIYMPPHMGKRKFSYKGKLHGRNEMISDYLWIAYRQSMKPGERLDRSMKRTRKQISSHIQVVKNFFKGHPEYFILFPSKTDPKNGFEDSLKDNPTLLAISEGRLPNNRFEHYNQNDSSIQMHDDHLIQPTHFWLLITTQSVPDETEGRYSTEEDLHNAGVVAHKFSGLSAQRGQAPLDSIFNWQQKFPTLERLRMTGELSCEIIHMEVSLNLMVQHPPEGSELCCRTELSIPGRQPNGEWRIVTTFVKPRELCCNPRDDPPLKNVELPVGILSSNEIETRIKVPFPANAWANAFTQLINIRSRFEDRRRAQAMGSDVGPPVKSVRQYIDELSMYQEIQSASPGGPYIRRAIIIWTFHKSRQAEGSSTSWRYIDHLPPRRSCMSPSPNPNHHFSSSMNENLYTWASEPMFPNPNILDPFNPASNHGLSYPTQDFTYPHQQYDLPPANRSFISNHTADSESTLVENETSNIDHYLTNATTQLTDFDAQPNPWLTPTQSFEADPTWESTFNPPVSTPHVPWDDAKAHVWPDVPEQKSISWIEDEGRHEWQPEVHSPAKSVNVELRIEQRLAPWIEQHDERERVAKEKVVLQEEMGVGGEVKGDEGDWVDHNEDEEEFDYAALVEKLK